MATIKAQLETLNVERDQALAKSKDLLKAAGESGLTDELTAELDALAETAKTADVSITELIAQDTAIKARLEAINGFADRSGEVDAARGVHVPAPAGEPQAAFKMPATVRRYNKLTSFVGMKNGQQPEERAYRFGQYAMAKLAADMPGRFNFPHAQQFSRDQFGLGQPMAVHGSGAADTSGSHVFVPDEFGQDLIALRELYGVARGVFKNRTMTTDTRTDPRRVSGLTAYFVGENSAGTESDAAYDQVSLTARDLMCITRMSSQLSEDSVIDFGNELANEIAIAFAQKEDEVCFNGTGISTDGGISGLRTKLATLTAATVGSGLVEATGATWASIVLADLEEVASVLPTYADVAGGASWICHKSFFWQVMVSLLNAAGGVTPADIQGGKAPMFLGYPVHFSVAYPSATAVSSVVCTFGNYAMSGTFGDRRQETISFSDSASVGGQSMWERNQIGVKGTERFDFKCHSFGSDTVPGPVIGLETKAS